MQSSEAIFKALEPLWPQWPLQPHWGCLNNLSGLNSLDGLISSKQLLILMVGSSLAPKWSLNVYFFFQAEAITVLHDSNLEKNSSHSGGLCDNKNLDMLCNKHLENSTTILTTTKSKCWLIFWNSKYDYLNSFHFKIYIASSWNDLCNYCVSTGTPLIRWFMLRRMSDY